MTGPGAPAGGATTFGWAVLSLVFLDEVAAAVAVGVWGAHVGSPGLTSVLLAVALPVALVLLWWAFASPKAPFGGPVVRPVVKVLVFGLACLGLWHAGHPVWALTLLVFSAVVNALAQLPQVRALVPTRPPRPEPSRPGV